LNKVEQNQIKLN